MEVVCGFVFADVIFRRHDTKAGNTSVCSQAIAKRKPEKNSGLNGIRTQDLSDTGGRLESKHLCQAFLSLSFALIPPRSEKPDTQATIQPKQYRMTHSRTF